MTGHHIYTRSWFERGSKHKNAGTFTVELTDGIFGDYTDSVIYDKLNPMYGAPVPKTLAPDNSGQSLLRIFHLSPDTTIVNRHWNVTDELTGRGIVTYSYSLIFRGNENESFLKYPVKAFETGAFEPYESFCARVAPDAPTALSKKYDPKTEDYTTPFVFQTRGWVHEFGFTQGLFVSFYTSLCNAVCSKKNAKVGLILPEGGNGERLILAVLSLLPMFMKKKFGAASRWTGMMEGHSSKAVEGLQFLCYYGEMPLSDSKFPVFDLTGSCRHENIDAQGGGYATWVWDNLDDPETIFGFEKFMTDNFAKVWDKMPFEVVEACFYIWSVFDRRTEKLDYQAALKIVKIIMDNFANSFAKFPIIYKRLDRCLSTIEQKIKSNSGVDMDTQTVQALCLLTNNGSEKAKALLYEVHKYFFGKNDFKKISITTSYFSEYLSRVPNIPAEDEDSCRLIMTECLLCGDPKIASDARGTTVQYCHFKRAAMLETNDDKKADDAFEAYKKAISSLYTAYNGKLPSELFQLPAIKESETLNQGMFIELMIYDINSLDYIPSIERWKSTLKWLADFHAERVERLFSLYYEKIPNDKEQEYMLELEDTGVLQALISLNDKARKGIEASFGKIFKADWTSVERPLNSDDTWQYVGNWLKRMKNLGITEGGGIKSYIREIIGLDKENLIQISCDVSQASIEIIDMLYGQLESLRSIIADILRMDSIVMASKKPAYRNLFESHGYLSAIVHSETVAENRGEYWYKQILPRVKWALLMAVITSRYGEFETGRFLKACREKRGGSSFGLVAQDMADIFEAVNYLDNYPNDIRINILDSFSSEISAVMHADEVFCDEAVSNAFGAINDDNYEWKNRNGQKIANRLRGRNVDPGIISKYSKAMSESRVEEHISLESDGIPLIFIIAAFAVLALLTAAAGALIFFWGNGLITPFFTSQASLLGLYILAGLLLASTVCNLILYFIRK